MVINVHPEEGHKDLSGIYHRKPFEPISISGFILLVTFVVTAQSSISRHTLEATTTNIDFINPPPKRNSWQKDH